MIQLFRGIQGLETDPLWGPTNVLRYAPANSLNEKLWINLDEVYARISTDPVYPGSVNSVGLTMPTGFTVGNSPVTETGILAVTNTFTAGSVVFAMGSGFAQDNDNLFWNDTDNRLGVGINSSLSARVHIKGTGTTSATNSLLVENSAGNDYFWVQDDGVTIIRTGTNQRFNFNQGNLAIIDDSGIIRASIITAQTITWNYCNFVTANLGVVTNGVNGVAWDLPMTATNFLTDTGTTKFMHLRPTINQSNVADFIAFHYAPTVTAIGGRHYSAIFEKGDMVIGGTSAHASSAFQVDSLVKGFLPPRMTQTQRDAISSPTAGLVIYNLSTNKLNVYTTTWEAFTSS